MQNPSILPSSTVTSSSVANETTITNEEISILSQHESHDLCLEDLLRLDENSYEKLMKSGDNETRLIPHLNAFSDNTGVMAFNNINYGMNSLGSNGDAFNMNFPPTLETINEDSIKELLGALR